MLMSLEFKYILYVYHTMRHELLFVLPLVLLPFLTNSRKGCREAKKVSIIPVWRMAVPFKKSTHKISGIKAKHFVMIRFKMTVLKYFCAG